MQKIVNGGEMTATMGGNLIFSDGRVENRFLALPGSITAEAGSVVRLLDVQVSDGEIHANGDNSLLELRDSTLTNAVLLTTGAGRIVNTTTAVLDGVMNLGEFEGADGSTTHLVNNIVNDGTIGIISMEGQTKAVVRDPRSAGPSTLTLSGIGELQRVSQSLTTKAAITGAVAQDTLINDAGHTIVGAGELGKDRLTIVNRGTIEVSGLIDPSTGGLTNEASGKIQVPDFGSLLITDEAGGDGDLVNRGMITVFSSTFLTIDVPNAQNHMDIIANRGEINIDGSTMDPGGTLTAGPGGCIRLTNVTFKHGDLKALVGGPPFFNEGEIHIDEGLTTFDGDPLVTITGEVSLASDSSRHVIITCPGEHHRPRRYIACNSPRFQPPISLTQAPPSVTIRQTPTFTGCPTSLARVGGGSNLSIWPGIVTK